jgi:8-amino-7-oxononanoate synthase
VDDTNATATVAAAAAAVAATDTINGGTGVLAALGLEEHRALLAGIFTFGKAAGCHGAVITGSCILMEYLVNYARPFIYSTSLPPHSLVTIKCAYDTMLGQEGEKRRNKVFCLVQLFRSKMMHGLQELYRRLNLTKAKKHNVENVLNTILLPSPSPIQAVMCRGNDHCVRVARRLRSEGGIAVFAIRSPTVPKGQERIRIILHAHNTEDEVLHLVHCLLQYAFLLDQTQEAYNDDDDGGGDHGTLSHHEHGQKVPLQSKL